MNHERIKAALQIFGLVDESARGAFEHTVAGLIKETLTAAEEKFSRLHDNSIDADEDIAAAAYGHAGDVISNLKDKLI